MRKGFRLLEDSCPVRIVAIHAFNTVSFLDMLLAIIKPLMRSDLLRRTRFHPSSLNFEEFYEKHVPRSCLPSDVSVNMLKFLNTK